MNFGILVNEGPYTHQASDSAYHFCRAALAAGHQIQRVFFYHDGVNNASRLTEPPQDDRNIVNRWSKFAAEHKVDLVARLDRRLAEQVGAVARLAVVGPLVDHHSDLHGNFLPT